MTISKTRSNLLLASAFVGLFSATAAFAQTTDYTQLKDALTSQFVTLKLPSDNLGMLTIEQLTELTSKLNFPGTDEVKAARAALYMDETLHPSTVAIDSPEGMQMIEDLKAKFNSINEPYPTAPMTSTQVQALLNVFVTLDNVMDKEARQKQAIQSAMADMNRPADAVNATAGAVQIEAQVYAKLVSLGLTPPPANSLSFEDLTKLQAVLEASATDEVKKSGAMLILSGK